MKGVAGMALLCSRTCCKSKPVIVLLLLFALMVLSLHGATLGVGATVVPFANSCEVCGRSKLLFVLLLLSGLITQLLHGAVLHMVVTVALWGTS